MDYLETIHPELGRVVDNIEKVMAGKREAAVLCLTALLAKGHVLLEDVPGVGKTMLVRSIAKSLGADFRRIQFTPDLLPSDVTGISIYNPQRLEFEYRPGPIMGNIVLADEINRTSPKTQSSLLEAMEEGSVTIDGVTRQLEQPFFVLATQNPIEYEGTYPLPEAQLDRFLFKIKMGYPSPKEELLVLNRADGEAPITHIESVISKEDLIGLQNEMEQVYMDDTVKRYIIDVVTKTRNHPSVYLGASPRGSVSLMKAAKAFAFLSGRDYVIPDDVQYLASFALPHRMILKSEARYEGHSAMDIVEEIISRTPVPVKRSMTP
ncbi:AAA domain-containing protein [Bacillus mangrovi]|uniref:AAA domain-containing protein n=1 Tax=Metabacillus mangrovi TaxID=1491830 RepID=A0A7X2V6B2_9BACI|nr:MoxR family ATPase [Metabacillus mangrovi]MTH55320.1 AAA domain-containing protein [Metabacillus mangrovi]